jgi:ribonucleoside-diphosphate reductase alpha chain
MGEIESTNPCGEQPLLPYESCNLGSINLNAMIKEENGEYLIDWKKLEDTVLKAVHFLDNVIDVNKYPLEQIDFTTKQSRKIGLGVMGFADMLLRLRIPYDSDEAVETAERVMGFILEKGRQASRRLAKQRGSFPKFGESIYAGQEPLRNATITTIAPTGTLSIISGCSSGIEPIFAYVYVRNVMDNTELLEVNPILKEELKKRKLYSDELMRKIAAEGTLAHIEEIPQDIKRVFVSSHDISPEYHIRLQAAFQKYTDNAVSKTVNFRKEATCEEVDKVYKLAYKLGCKGVTIYRDGSRESQVLNIKKEGQGAEEQGIMPRPRPDIVNGFTEKVKIGCGNLYITVNFDDKGIVEVFTNTGKAGGCPSQSEATARLVSVSLRSGVDIKTVVEQLKGIRCASTIRQQGMKVTSCPDAIARVIEKVVKMQEEIQNGSNGKKVINELVKTSEEKEFVPGRTKFCPECGKQVIHEGGCVICRNCGYSKCG